MLGTVATIGLTAVFALATEVGLSRLDLPLLLGTVFVADADRARVAGLCVHVVIGEVFALWYFVAFASFGHSAWWLGALLGVGHATMSLTVLVPVLPGIHPRMGSMRSGPDSSVVIQAPGFLARNYGRAVPAVAVVSHALYGSVLSLAAGR